jgi:hypothetical protein
MSEESKPAEVSEPVAADVSADPVASEDAEFDRFTRTASKKIKDTSRTEKAREVAAEKRKTPPKDPEPEDEAPPHPAAEEKTDDEPATAEPEEAPAAKEDASAKKRKLADDAARFAALERRERQARQVEQQAKERVDAAESRAREAQEALQEVERFRQDFDEVRKNPLKLLERAGYNLEDVFQYVLNDQKHTPDFQTRDLQRQFEERFKAMEQRYDQERKQREDALRREESASQDRAVADFQRSCVGHVKSNPDKYELIVQGGYEDEVFEYVRLWFDKNGEMLDVETAAERVEAGLEQRARALLQSKKLGFQPQTQAAPPLPSKPSADARAKASTTISNSLASSPGAVKDDPLFGVNEDEAMEYLAKKARALSKRA